jgi:hypothetical protein
MTVHTVPLAERSVQTRWRWMTLLRERAPLPALALVGLAQSLSASALTRGEFGTRWIITSTIAIVGLLVLLRLMDEVKDVAKDRVAHPDRPLPRGLLTVAEIRRAIAGLGAALVLGAVIIGFVRAPIAGALYAATVAYAGLMYREFFSARLCGANAFVYAATHQVIIVPLYLVAVACAAPDAALSAPAIWFALSGLGASWVIEVSRKLDPAAPPILRTYLRAHGKPATAAAILAGLALVWIATHAIGVHAIVGPFVVLMTAAVPLLWIAPGRYRLIEGSAALLACAQMLAPLVHYLWRVAA